MAFDHDFIELDEYGPVRMRCMACGMDIGRRSYVYVQSHLDATKTLPVAIFQKLANCNQVRVALSDGSFTNWWFCGACKDIDLDASKDREKVGAIFEQMVRTDAKMKTFHGEPLEEVEDHRVQMAKLEPLCRLPAGKSIRESHEHAKVAATAFAATKALETIKAADAVEEKP